MNITNNSGFFSVDLLFAFLLVLLLVFLILDFQFNILFSLSDSFKSFELSEKTIMLADCLVKNFDENNALLGSAFFDYSKHRVVSNLLDYSFLKTAKPLGFGKIRIVELSIQKKNSKKEILFSKSSPEGKNCLCVKRFVLLNHSLEKALVGVIACEI